MEANMFERRLMATALFICFLVVHFLAVKPIAQRSSPSVLTIRERAAVVHKIVQKRLDTLLPRLMREAGFDMWVLACNEDNLDPVFETMMPFENWNPIRSSFSRQGTGQSVERINVSRTDTRGCFRMARDPTAFDARKVRANGRPSGESFGSAAPSGSGSTRARPNGRPAD
jgi:hypothetical protein